MKHLWSYVCHANTKSIKFDSLYTTSANDSTPIIFRREDDSLKLATTKQRRKNSLQWLSQMWYHNSISNEFEFVKVAI